MIPSPFFPLFFIILFYFLSFASYPKKKRLRKCREREKLKDLYCASNLFDFRFHSFFKNCYLCIIYILKLSEIQFRVQKRFSNHTHCRSFARTRLISRFLSRPIWWLFACPQPTASSRLPVLERAWEDEVSDFSLENGPCCGRMMSPS